MLVLLKLKDILKYFNIKQQNIFSIIMYDVYKTILYNIVKSSQYTAMEYMCMR